MIDMKTKVKVFMIVVELMRSPFLNGFIDENLGWVTDFVLSMEQHNKIW